MPQVRGFVKRTGALTSNISGLNRVSKILVKRRDALDKMLQVRAGRAEQPASPATCKPGTLDTRDNAGRAAQPAHSRPAAVLCTFAGAGARRQAPAARSPLALKTPSLPRAKPFAGDPSAGGGGSSEPIDRTLGGLVEVTR